MRSKTYRRWCAGVGLAGLVVAATVVPAGAHSTPVVSAPIVDGLAAPLQFEVEHGKVLVAQSFSGTVSQIDRDGTRTDLFNDPHLIERGFVHRIHHDELGEVPLLGWPARMSASQVPIVAAPVLGKHTADVVAQDLGLSAGEIASLRAKGVLGPEREAPARREA